jgi:hypothetical protein
MSACVIITPIVIANWPMIMSAISSAAAASGFNLAPDSTQWQEEEVTPQHNQLDLKMKNVQDVQGSMGRDEKIVVERDGVRVIFSRDGRGHFKTCVEGKRSKAELEAIGQELGERVVQQYVYQRVAQELEAQGFVTLDEEQTEDQTIRLRVRRYED